MSTLKLVAFFTLVLGFELVHFDPQLINKIPISSISPLIKSIGSPSLAPLAKWSLTVNFFNLALNWSQNLNRGGFHDLREETIRFKVDKKTSLPPSILYAIIIFFFFFVAVTSTSSATTTSPTTWPLVAQHPCHSISLPTTGVAIVGSSLLP